MFEIKVPSSLAWDKLFDGWALCQQLQVVLNHGPTARLAKPSALQVIFLLGQAHAFMVLWYLWNSGRGGGQ